jgi:hypothetical protein
MGKGIYRNGRVYYQVDLKNEDDKSKPFGVIMSAEVINMSQLWTTYNQEVTFKIDENGYAVLLSLGEIRNEGYVEENYLLN